MHRASVADVAIDDLIPRAEVFRSKLIDTFQLLDSLQDKTDAPKYYSSELAECPELMDEMMINHPDGLVKFKVYSHDDDKRCVDVDRRLNKVRMKSNFAIYCFAPWAKEITENKKFQIFMSYLILLNSLVLGIQSEINHYYPDSDWAWCLDIFDQVSLVMFVFEILLKLMDQQKAFWKNGWNNFDFVITMMTLVLAFIADEKSSGDANSTKGNLSYIGILKVFRILRSLKMLTRFAQLRLIVLTIIKALSSIGVITFLLLILIYLFAVMGLIFFKAYNNPTKLNGFVPQYNRYGEINVTQRFGSFLNSTIMVFQLFTVDSWHTLCMQIQKDGLVPTSYVYFYVIAWLFIGAILFKNIFVGIMVMNFKTIRDDFLEQCTEREKDIELGQKELLLEVELAMHHAKSSNLSEFSRKTSLSCGFGTGMVPIYSKANDMPLPLQTIAEGNLSDDESDNSQGSPPPVIKGTPFKDTIMPSLSDEQLQKQQQEQEQQQQQEPQTKKEENSQETLKNTASSTSQSKTAEDFIADLKQTRSMMMDEKEEFPESKSWNDTVRWNFSNFDSGKETLWPRDTLFKYIQLMETLQDNLVERHQLQRLSVRAISNMFDSNFLHD